MSDDRGRGPDVHTGAETGGHAPLVSAGTCWSDFHAMAAERGDGMHPALLAALERDRIANVKAALARRNAAMAAQVARAGAQGAIPGDAVQWAEEGGNVVHVDFTARRKGCQGRA